MVGGLSPEVMQTFGIEGAQLLTNGERIFVQWLGNLASSPFQTTTTVLMQSALTRKWTVTSSGDFFDMVLHDMVLNGSIGGFFSLHRPTAPRRARARGVRDPARAAGAEAAAGEAAGFRRAGARRSAGWARRGRRARTRHPPTRSGDTLTGMGPAGPAGENAPPANRSGDTLTGMGAAGPTAAGRQVRPITDVAEAQAAFNRAEANGDRYRWPRDPKLVKDLWVREAGQDRTQIHPRPGKDRTAWWSTAPRCLSSWSPRRRGAGPNAGWGSAHPDPPSAVGAAGSGRDTVRTGPTPTRVSGSPPRDRDAC